MKKKLNSKGFAHHIVIVAVVIVAVIGGIGSYVYLRSSSAATPVSAAKALCGKGYGWWIVSHSIRGQDATLFYMGNKAGDQCATIISTGAGAKKARVMSVSIHVRNDKYHEDSTLKSNTGTVKSHLNAIHVPFSTARNKCKVLKADDLKRAYYAYFSAKGTVKVGSKTVSYSLPTTPGDSESPDCNSVLK